MKQPVKAGLRPKPETVLPYLGLGVVRSHHGPKLYQRRLHSQDGAHHANTLPPAPLGEMGLVTRPGSRAGLSQGGVLYFMICDVLICKLVSMEVEVSSTISVHLFLALLSLGRSRERKR